jgi:alpha-beta hydrolase superfamily lysophospholipase
MDLDALKDLPRFNFDDTRPSDALNSYRRFYRFDTMVDSGEVSHHAGTLEINDFSIVTHFFTGENTRGTVFFLHGYLDHVGLFAPLIRHLVGNGYAVLACDLPGHGLSSGERMGIGNFAQYTDVLEYLIRQFPQRLPEPWSLLGQSMGGAVIMDLLLNRDCLQHISHAVVLAPLVRPLEWFSIKWRYLLGRYIVRQVPRVFRENSHDREFLQFVRNDPLQSTVIPISWVGALMNWVSRFQRSKPCALPLQVIQGDDETTVDWRYNLQQIRSKFPACQVHMIDGGRHHLPNECGTWRDAVYRCIDEALQR